MTNFTKMTYKKALNYVLENYDVPNEVAEKLNNMIAQQNKHCGVKRKPSARQIANEKIKDTILSSMNVGTMYSINNMLKNFGFGDDITPQRISALLIQLIEEKKIVRIEDKRKVYFQLA